MNRTPWIAGERDLKGFRPQYRKIGDLKAVLTKKVPFMAATATANAVARAGIPKALHFGTNYLEINLGNHRNNLAYSVHKLKSVSNCAHKILHYFPSKSKIAGYTLIFVSSRPVGTQVLTVLCNYFIPELSGRIKLYHSSWSKLDKEILAAGFEKEGANTVRRKTSSIKWKLDF
ncbi:unnamed protein product [Rhizoctonia solani]|uniref:Uncharacterized protein n=1 Tax=Rhizoctonia solani TaxID=456999 RepID=A0A8H3BCF0_9AGAM|nr:unnamed protein product [Rhizoctonia solani]